MRNPHKYHTYLQRSQVVCSKNNKQSEFDAYMSCVPQGSIFGPILFNIFSMFFCFLFQRRPFIILWMAILIVVLQKHSKS